MVWGTVWNLWSIQETNSHPKKSQSIHVMTPFELFKPWFRLTQVWLSLRWADHWWPSLHWLRQLLLNKPEDNLWASSGQDWWLDRCHWPPWWWSYVSTQNQRRNGSLNFQNEMSFVSQFNYTWISETKFSALFLLICEWTVKSVTYIQQRYIYFYIHVNSLKLWDAVS